MSTGIIVLAAGTSSRLGKPKQLLMYKNKTLLSIAIEAATATSNHTIVVIGAYAKEMIRVTKNKNVHTVHNPHYEEGMASSITTGLNEMLRVFPETEQVIITVCDQPFISASVLYSLIEKKRLTSKGIVASSYNLIAGAPVLFDKFYFPVLMELKGQEGAEKITYRIFKRS